MNPEPALLRFGIHSVCLRGVAIGERDCGRGRAEKFVRGRSLVSM